MTDFYKSVSLEKQKAALKEDFRCEESLNQVKLNRKKSGNGAPRDFNNSSSDDDQEMI
jgi:hypothetical protein